MTKHIATIGATITAALWMSLLTGCAEMQKTVGTYKEHKVQTKTSEAIYVDPVARERRTIYLDVKSGVDAFDRRAFRQFVGKQFESNDNAYAIIDDPDRAQFTMVAYVLNLEETSAEGAKEMFMQTTTTRDKRGRVTSQRTEAVENKTFAELVTGKNPKAKRVIALVCDVQIRERAAEGALVRKDSQIDTRISGAGSARQSVSEVSDRKEYRTRILTTAEGVNFELPDVQGEMFQKTAAAMSGFF